MIVQEFSFGNFKSFKEVQTLNLTAAKIKSKHPEIDEHNVFSFEGSKNSFLKTKAIYGANASGKSNITRAFVAFSRLVKSSVKDDNVLRFIESFKLSTQTEEEPSFFQMVFFIDKIKYRYGFEVDEQKIHAEWLFSTLNRREIPLFIRDGQHIVEIDKTNFSEGSRLMSLVGEDTEGNEIFRENSLFITALSSFGFAKTSKSVVENIGSVLVIPGLGNNTMFHNAGKAILDDNIKKYVLDLFKYGDFGIEDIEAIDLSNEKEEEGADFKKKVLISTRKKFDEKLKPVGDEYLFLDHHESEGTRKLFEIGPLLYLAIKEQRPIIIDEFDARFHPLITKNIVELFNSAGNIGAQFIFITHDTNLLSADLLRRDQIEFVEKDKYGASHLYSLVEFKGIRNNASFEKDYINGKYGAIPFLGDFKKLLNPERYAEED